VASRGAFQRYWQAHAIPFPGLPDPARSVTRLYRQRVDWLKLGRMPTLLLIDRSGLVRYRHDGASMADIPENADLLARLDELNAGLAPSA
jgi:hypothetical protein